MHAQARLEHANITVSDLDATAAMLNSLFGWETRWEGEAIDGGRSIHVGTKSQYLAIYNPGKPLGDAASTYREKGGLNHVGVVVDDLDAAEARVRDAGYTVGQHYDYEPGRRFYFRDHDGIEFEVICYE